MISISGLEQIIEMARELKCRFNAQVKFEFLTPSQHYDVIVEVKFPNDEKYTTIGSAHVLSNFLKKMINKKLDEDCVRKGLEQAAAGDLHYLGSFSKYCDDKSG